MFLGHTVEDGSGWTHRDRELARALEMHESTTCGQCGHSLLETSDPDREGWYDLAERVCAGCIPLDKDRRERKAPLPPGTRLVSVLNPRFKPTSPSPI